MAMIDTACRLGTALYRQVSWFNAIFYGFANYFVCVYVDDILYFFVVDDLI